VTVGGINQWGQGGASTSAFTTEAILHFHQIRSFICLLFVVIIIIANNHGLFSFVHWLLVVRLYIALKKRTFTK